MAKSYKVLHINNVADVGFNLVKGLQYLGIDAQLYQPTRAGYRVRAGARALIPYHRTRESIQLKRYVKDNGINLIHVHYATFAYMTLITGLPYVLHCHGGDIDRDLKRPGLRQLIILALRKAQMVFCSTPNLIEPIKPYRPDVIFLPSPVDTELFHPAHVESNGKQDILSISKLDRKKGISRVLATIENIWHERPDTCVGMFAFGSEGSIYQSFLDQYRHKLTIYPQMKHEEMPGLINSYPLILGQQDPTRRAMGVSELEAMACEKPVSCLYGYLDAYPQPPPLISSNTPDEASAKVLSLIEEPERARKIGEDSRKWVCNFHSLQVVAQKLLKWYQEIES